MLRQWVNSTVFYKCFPDNRQPCPPSPPHFLPCQHNKEHSPTLYSEITGKYASVESKIFPHILLLCSISYSCFNGLTINQHFIKPLQGEKCTSYLSVVDLSIVLPVCSFSQRYVGAPIYGYARVHERQRNCCDRRFSGCLQ